MIYQAVVIIWILGTPSPIQIDGFQTSENMNDCYETAALMITKVLSEVVDPVISAQGFCILNPKLKKKDTMQNFQDSTKGKTRDKII